MLTVVGLKKCLPGGRELFRQLDLELSAGECVAIMGESGAGKSTLLNIIAGLDQFDAGSITLDQRALQGLSDRELTALRRERFGFVFQAFHILPHLSLLQNVELTLLLNQVPSAAARVRAGAILAEVGLGARIDDFPRQLSGGELQRVAIARALVHRPAVLLADEPTGNLDPENAQRVLALMSDLMRKDGTATLLVTHSEATAAVADRKLRLTAHGLEPF